MANKTPFLKAFGPLLFGRAPRKVAEKLGEIRGLEDIYSLFGELIPKAMLEGPESGEGSRDRKLPGRVTFWAFVTQVLSPGMGCGEIVSKVQAWWRWAQIHEGETLTTSAYTQARKRLDKDDLLAIAGQIAWSLGRHTHSSENWLEGRPVKIIDGTSVSMPDTPENQAVWPQPSSQKPGCGFPLMKLTGLFSLGSGALIDHAISNQHVHESQLFRQMWPRLRQGDVLLGDRGFCSYTTLATLAGRGIDGVFRLHQARKADFRQGRLLGPEDRLVEWTKPSKAPAGFSDEEFAALPETLPLRMIRLQVASPGFRTQSAVVVTTLLDSNLYPADAIRALYGQRWSVELHFHQIKTLMALDVLRCKTPAMIEKELIVHLIAYNLIRVLMQRAAHLHAVPLERISFKGALDTSRHFADVIHAASKTPRKQKALIEEMLSLIATGIIPARPGRSEPRAKKRRPKNFQILTKPRSKMGNLPHRNRPQPKSPKSTLS